MGPPKQMWTAEEEAALKAGIAKYGTGSWSRILKDPEFWSVLFCRSNVDLKDKWRNIQVTESGSGSRSKSNRPVVNNMQSIPMPAGSSVHFADGGSKKPVPRSNRPVVNNMQPTPMPADSSVHFADGGAKKPVPRLPGHISGAITDLKEPHGSSQTASAVKIEVNRQYGIAPSSSPFDDAELEKMRGMTPREAAAAAAKAVAEAEAAMTAAEEAVREAEEAEALAEEMRVYAESVRKRLRRRRRNW